MQLFLERRFIMEIKLSIYLDKLICKKNGM